MNIYLRATPQVDWKTDAPEPTVKKQEFGFEITGIDVSKNSAELVGRLGSTSLLAFSGTDVVNFIEQTPFGLLNVTSVFATRDTTGRFKAVHSRHLSGRMVGAPFPSQNYGSCTAK